MSTSAIRCSGLTQRFGAVVAVKDVEISLDRGKFLALLGPSGSGKTTLLRMIAGFEMPNAGTVEIGEQLMVAPDLFVPPERRRVGMVFQHYALFPHLSVAQNISYGLPRNEARKSRVDEVLELVGLVDLGSRMPHQLSGGQQQRIALARALAPRPEVILLDEPFSNLDPSMRVSVREEVKSILREANETAVFVTHDQEEAFALADDVAIMRQGKIEQVATPEQLFHHPVNRFVATFVGQADFLPGKVVDSTIRTELGPLPAKDLNNGAELDVLVRPDDIAITPRADGIGQIVLRRFRGGENLYCVQLPSGRCIHSHQPGRAIYRTGTRVEVSMETTELVTFPGQNGLGSTAVASRHPTEDR